MSKNNSSKSKSETALTRPTDSFIQKQVNKYYQNQYKESGLFRASRLNFYGCKPKRQNFHFDSKRYRKENQSLPFDFGSYALSFLHSRDLLVENGNLLSSSENYQVILFSEFLSIMDSLYPNFSHCCECLNNSRYHKRERVKEDISLIFDSVFLVFESKTETSNNKVLMAWFVKCSFSPEYRQSHSDKKLKSDLQSFADSHFGLGVGNFDIGVSEDGQHLLHSHWVCSRLSYTDDKGKADFSRLQQEYKSIFGYVCDFEPIYLYDIYQDTKSYENNFEDIEKLSRYMTKFSDDILILSLHATKDSAIFSNIMQTKELRDFKKDLKEEAKKIFLNSQQGKKGGSDYEC